MSKELLRAINREYPISTLIIPKSHNYDLTQETFSAAAQSRASRRVTLSLRRPGKEPRNVLQKIGLEDIEKLRPEWSEPNPATLGSFVPMGSVGMSAAFFGDEKHEDDARSELDDEYEFVRDFKLNIPSPVRGQHRGRAALDAAEWPEESGVRAAHAQGIKGAGVLVGVCDTGVDADHDEFRHQTINFRYVSLFPNSPYWPPRDVRGFDVDGHGTHVCGIIAGQKTGVAPDANLYTASVIESETTSTSMIRTSYGLNWLLRQFSRPDNEHRPAVLSMSLGFPETVGQDPKEHAKRLRVMEMLLQTLVQANVVPVVAIGNDGAGEYGYPGAFANVIGVGAVDFDKQVAPFSGSGTPPGGANKPDVVGYGVSVYSSIERSYDGRSTYQRLSGTSMATPYVAGVAALYRCQQPALTADEVRDKLHQTAIGLPGQPKKRTGSGLVVFRTPGADVASARIPRGKAPVKPVDPSAGRRGGKGPKRRPRP